MEPSAQIPHSINIETVGWGSEGKAALRELEVFLNGCGIPGEHVDPQRPPLLSGTRPGRGAESGQAGSLGQTHA